MFLSQSNICLRYELRFFFERRSYTFLLTQSDAGCGGVRGEILALRQVRARESYMPKIALSKRNEILRLLREGYLNKEVAEMTGVSASTVSSRRRLRRKTKGKSYRMVKYSKRAACCYRKVR